MKQLIYISRATVPFSSAELAGLLAKSRSNNLAVNVSGILVYHEGNFLQVLEGADDDVYDRFRRVITDTRHADVQVLVHDHIGFRSFSDWSMGFVESSELPLSELPGFVDFFRHSRSPDTMIQRGGRAWSLLSTFREGRWLRHVETGAKPAPVVTQSMTPGGVNQAV